MSAFLGSMSLPARAWAAEATFGGQPVSTWETESVKVEESRISGSGRVVFREGLDAWGGNSSHALSFRLQDGGSLTFVTYASSDLAGGLEFRFARSGTALTVTLSREGFAPFDISSFFSAVDASRVIDLQIDVHNSENPAHVLIWNALEPHFTDDTALMNSGTQPVSPGAGAGNHRGFLLDRALLLKAQASKAMSAHEH